MSNLVKRIIAYIIDILLVTLMCQCLSNTTLLNPNLNKYEKYRNEYNDYYINYANYIKQLYNYYTDKELSEEEYNKLVKDNEQYIELTQKYYIDSKLTEKNYNKIIMETAKEYRKTTDELNYKLEKNSISEKIIYLLLVILYFVGFNYITNGQTVGKRIMKLRIENIDENEKVPITSYIIRTIFLYQTLFYIAKLISILYLSKAQYISVINTFYSIQNFLDIVIITVILIRKQDGRGPHDLLARTKVVKVEKNIKE